MIATGLRRRGSARRKNNIDAETIGVPVGEEPSNGAVIPAGMKALLAAACAMIALTGCEELRPAAVKSVEYRPQEAGTVDHAMCLLGFTGVGLRELATGHHLVEARLNGRDATFVLDTGANATVLHAGHAAAFGLSKSLSIPVSAVGLGGAMKASQARLDTLSIGSVPIRRSRIMVADLSQLTNLLGPMSGGTIHGIIGQDVMKEHRAVIDVARPILYLIEGDQEPAPVPAERCTRAADAPESPSAKKS